MLKYKLIFGKRLINNLKKYSNIIKLAISEKEFYNIYALELLCSLAPFQFPHLQEKLETRKNNLLLKVAEYYLKNLHLALLGEATNYKSEIYENHSNYYKTNLVEKLDDEEIYLKDLSIDQLISLFEDFSWHSHFGGKRWGNIGRVYKELDGAFKSKNYKELMILIDRVHQLEHNTGSIFIDFPGAEVSWIYDALTNKAMNNSIHIISENCSPDLKRLLINLYDKVPSKLELLVDRGGVLYNKYINGNCFINFKNLRDMAIYLIFNGDMDALVNILTDKLEILGKPNDENKLKIEKDITDVLKETGKNIDFIEYVHKFIFYSEIPQTIKNILKNLTEYKND